LGLSSEYKNQSIAGAAVSGFFDSFTTANHWIQSDGYIQKTAVAVGNSAVSIAQTAWVVLEHVGYVANQMMIPVGAPPINYQNQQSPLYTYLDERPPMTQEQQQQFIVETTLTASFGGGIKPIGVANTMGNIQKLTPHQLKNAGINEHLFKAGEVGNQGGKFNISINTTTGELVLTPVRKGSIPDISTGRYLNEFK